MNGTQADGGFMIKHEERRYPIKPDEGYFEAGITNNHEQVLFGLLCPDLVAFFFDSEGNLLRIEKRTLDFFHDVQPPYNIYDGRIPKHVDTWKRDMGLQPAVISIKRFFSEDLYIGIEDYPNHFEDNLADPEASEEEKDDVRNSMQLWDKDGQFVLWWGNDYWLDGSGRVVSS
jgi:hypothetical protein